MEGKYSYGIHSVELLLKKSADQIIKIYLQANRQDKRSQTILALASKNKIPVVRWSKEKLDHLIHEVHQGVIAETKTGAKVLSENDLYALVESLEKPVRLLILDGVTDPHNLGACMRTADAAGIDAIIVPKDRSVGLNATVRKVSTGASEIIPFYAVTNLVRCLKQLKELGVWIIGTAGEAEQSLYQTKLSGALALVMGSEDKGLRRLTREHCDELVHIPLLGQVSSLNVSVATGICLFEIVRQSNS